jgi:hypothetical protein
MYSPLSIAASTCAFLEDAIIGSIEPTYREAFFGSGVQKVL